MLSVILYHAGLVWFPGGFVGVDVFFVISGYLITSIILSELEAGTFTIVGFYERRARRILPALFFVMVCAIPAAWLWLLPDQMAWFAKSLLSGLFFISNYYFRRHTGYFAPDSEQEPLLHLWSLAVEEQYYIFFPLLAWLFWNKKEWCFKVSTIIWRHKSWGFIALVLLVAVLSFSYAERHIGDEKLFYDTRGRVWELFIGSFTAIYLRGRQQTPKRAWAEIASMLGLVLILAAVFGLSKEQPFPGHWALLPTLGAVLVILFASPATLAGRLLSTRVMVGVGLISYSAYLWHWPLFAFARIVIPSPSINLFLALAAASLGMAWFSWRFVERPFRNRQLFKRGQIFRFAAAAGCALAGMGGIGFQGLASRFNAVDADLLISHKEHSRYVSARYRKLEKDDTFFRSEGKLKMLLLGDSFSKDFFNMMVEADLFPEAEIRARNIPARCQIYLGKENALELIEEKNRDLCAKRVYNPDFYPSIHSLLQSADIIVLASSWVEWSARRLPETIKNLHIPDTARVIVIGRKNFGAVRPLNYLGLSPQEKAGMKNRVDDSHYQTNEVMRENLKKMPNVEFVDLHSLICGEASHDCPVFSPDGKLLSYDGGHLAKTGAQYIGALLKGHPVFTRE